MNNYSKLLNFITIIHDRLRKYCYQKIELIDEAHFGSNGYVKKTKLTDRSIERLSMYPDKFFALLWIMVRTNNQTNFFPDNEGRNVTMHVGGQYTMIGNFVCPKWKSWSSTIWWHMTHREWNNVAHAYWGIRPQWLTHWKTNLKNFFLTYRQICWIE